MFDVIPNSSFQSLVTTKKYLVRDCDYYNFRNQLAKMTKSLAPITPHLLSSNHFLDISKQLHKNHQILPLFKKKRTHHETL